MKTAKIITICTGLVLLIVIATIGILGIVGYLKITEGVAAGVIITPAIGIILAIVNAKHLFDDPETTTKLKDEHADEVRRIKNEHADVIAQRDKADAKADARNAEIALKVHADYRATIAQKDAEINAAGVSAINEKTKRVEAERQLDIYKPRPNRPDGSRIAPGH